MSTLKELLTEHYYDAGWSKEHQGFRCVCGWLGEDHVAHVTDVLTSYVDEVMDREICTCEQCEDSDNYNKGARAVRDSVLKFLSGGAS